MKLQSVPRRADGGPTTVAEEPAACRGCRAPQYERGRRRVDAILDAASAILAEDGMAALTVDAIAKRSGTSKSSMYHFFPDRERVVDALAERHVANIRARDLLRLAEPVDWAALTLDQVVERYLDPFRTYIAQHPDVLQLLCTGGASGCATARASGLEALHLDQAERVVAARLPGARPAERRARALTMFAVVSGVIEVSSRMPPAARTTLMRELKPVLVAYLGAAEAGDTGR